MKRVPDQTLIDQNRLATVESYRRYLAEHWQICPYEDSALVEELLSPDDRESLRNWRRRLLATSDAAVHAQFYDWLAEPRRFGPVHSLKWMEILTSGIWAAAVLVEIALRGAVLDLGCNAGYWTTWLAAQRGGPVVGVDACGAAIELGRRRFAEGRLPGELRWGDLEQTVSKDAFAAAVSLQGLTRHFHGGEFDVLGKVASNVRAGGYLILVDELPGAPADFDRAFTAADLAVVAAGPVGGLGIDDEWKSYTGLVLQRGFGGQHVGHALSKAEAAVERAWEDIHPFATAPSRDWAQRNTASWWAQGAEPLLAL